MRFIKNFSFLPTTLTLGLTLSVTLSLAGCGQNAMAGRGDELAVNKIDGDFSVVVLGSGGPVATPVGRASASYLIYIDGQAKVLMDAGGGALLRLGQAGADIKDLDVILLSHLHLDHMADMPAIVKSMYFNNRVYNVNQDPITFPPGRTAPFHVYGPDTNGAAFPADVFPADVLTDPTTPQYPALSTFVNGQFDINNGINRYLNIFTRAISGGIFKYTTDDVSPDWQHYNPVTIYKENGLVIKAVGVNHGPVPALAYRIEYKGKSVVYSGDTSSKGDNMIEISRGADMLIYDNALFADTAPNATFNIFYALHTTPARIGDVAKQADVKALILSHITPQTEGHSEEIKDRIRQQGFEGFIKTANDLDVYNLLGKKDHH